MQVQNNVLLTLTTLLALSTAAPRVDQAGDTIEVDVPSQPKRYANDLMIVNDSRYLRDRPKDIEHVSEAGCVQVEQSGTSVSGLRPTDDIWCTIYKSRVRTIDNKQDKKQQVFIGFKAPRIRRWNERTNWWVKGGRDWFISSYDCFKKGSIQIGL